MACFPPAVIFYLQGDQHHRLGRLVFEGDIPFAEEREHTQEKSSSPLRRVRLYQRGLKRILDETEEMPALWLHEGLAYAIPTTPEEGHSEPDRAG